MPLQFQTQVVTGLKTQTKETNIQDQKNVLDKLVDFRKNILFKYGEEGLFKFREEVEKFKNAVIKDEELQLSEKKEIIKRADLMIDAYGKVKGLIHSERSLFEKRQIIVGKIKMGQPLNDEEKKSVENINKTMSKIYLEQRDYMKLFLPQNDQEWTDVYNQIDETILRIRKNLLKDGAFRNNLADGTLAIA